jgi:hypothetical protein
MCYRDDGRPCAHQQPRQPWPGDESIDQRVIIRNTGDNIYSMYFVIALYLLSGTLLLLAIRPASTAGVPAAAPAH